MPFIRRWAYGITTVPSRLKGLFAMTLEGLRVSGFNRPHVFLDGGTWQQAMEIETTHNLEVTLRRPVIRTYGNFLLGLQELYIRHNNMDFYAMFQDDIQLVKGLKSYLERIPYPPTGYYNLYTFPQNFSLCPDGGRYRGFYPSNQRGFGACALVFNRSAVITLLTHQHMIERAIDAHRGWRAVDGGIVEAMSQAGWKEWVHSPSLVQHVGMPSTMGNGNHPLAPNFPGQEFDAMTLLQG